MKKVSEEVVKIADGLLDLSTESRRVGMSASGLRTWQNAIEMLGGKAGEATSEVGKFMESLNALVYKGDVGDNLQWLARLGIPVRRGMTYEETAPQVFSAIKKGRASGTIKDDQEAGFIARQAGFGIVGDYITQRPNASAQDFNKFIASNRGRAIDEGSASSGANAMRSIIQAGQKLQQTKEGVVGRQSGRIGGIAQTAGEVKEFGWEFGEGAVNIAANVVTIIADKINPTTESNETGISRVVTDSGDILYYDKEGKYIKDQEAAAKKFTQEGPKKKEVKKKPPSVEREITDSGDAIYYDQDGKYITDQAMAERAFLSKTSSEKRARTEPSLTQVPVPPPTPNVSTDNSRSSNVTINQTNHIRSTEPAAAGREVASRTRKEIVGLSDGAGQEWRS